MNIVCFRLLVLFWREFRLVSESSSVQRCNSCLKFTKWIGHSTKTNVFDRRSIDYARQIPIHATMSDIRQVRTIDIATTSGTRGQLDSFLAPLHFRRGGRVIFYLFIYYYYNCIRWYVGLGLLANRPPASGRSTVLKNRVGDPFASGECMSWREKCFFFLVESKSGSDWSQFGFGSVADTITRVLRILGENARQNSKMKTDTTCTSPTSVNVSTPLCRFVTSNND